MNENNSLPIQVSHPAPHRARVGLAALLFGIVAAPAAWNAQILLSVALSGHACYPRDKPLAAPLWSNLEPILLTINIVSIAIAVMGGIVAWRSWLQTRAERPGSGHHLLESGDGRTRFMAMCGILISALFLLALIFGSGVVFMVPPCGP